MSENSSADLPPLPPLPPTESAASQNERQGEPGDGTPVQKHQLPASLSAPRQNEPAPTTAAQPAPVWSGIAQPAPAPTEPAPASGTEAIEHPLDPRSISADRLTRMIFAGILSTLSLIAVVFLTFTVASSKLLLPLLWLFFAAFLLVRAWWWPAVRYRHISYRIDQKVLLIRRGVWWRSVTLVPRSRVQHTDVSQGPIDRHFGLGTLVVHTAGTQFAAVPLSGLAHEKALEIRDLLIEESDADDAV